MDDRSRRTALQRVSPNPTTHAGLWLDRFLERQTLANGESSDLAKEARSKLVRQVDETLKLPPDYRTFALARLTSLLTPAPGRFIAWRAFRSVGRIVVGLGQSGVLENGIALERTWGVPILPGPSLKGVAAATAHGLLENTAWRKKQGDKDLPGSSAARLFGTTEAAGCVRFLDGLWYPASNSTQNGLHADVITVHNRAYYQGALDDERSPPDGTSSPVPVSFLSASGDFIVTLESAAEDSAWAESALQLLEIGLLRLGIGAKTNAGYGRLQPLPDDDPSTDPIRERLASASRAAAFRDAGPHRILNEVLRIVFQSKGACTNFAKAMEAVRGDDHATIALSDLVSGDEATRLLAQVPTASMSSAEQTNLLREVLREHPDTQSWRNGKPDGSHIKKGNGFFKDVAEWAGITDGDSQHEVSPAVALHATSTLDARYPDASALRPTEREALESLLASDGSVSEDALLAIMDRVAEENWSSAARAIVADLLDRLG